MSGKGRLEKTIQLSGGDCTAGVPFDLLDALKQAFQVFPRLRGKHVDRCVVEKKQTRADLAEHTVQKLAEVGLRLYQIEFVYHDQTRFFVFLDETGDLFVLSGDSVHS